MARSPISSCGTRCRQTTSFSCPQERFTRLAQVSSLRNSSSGATRRSVCSITVDSVNFKSKTPSWWRTPDRPIFRCDRASLPPNGGFSFPARTSYSNGSIWPPNSSWCLDAERETWLLVLGGSAIAGSFDVATGDALFAQSDRVDIHAGAVGMVGLVAYTGGGPVPQPAAASHTAGLNQCRTATGDAGANFSHSSKGCPKERPRGNN